jgi:hypothetical protein
LGRGAERIIQDRHLLATSVALVEMRLERLTLVLGQDAVQVGGDEVGVEMARHGPQSGWLSLLPFAVRVHQ